MTREELIKNLKYTMKKHEHDRVATFDTNISLMCKDMLDYLDQESSRDMEEIEEIINCDADAETRCNMISNILTAKPHYFEKQEPKTGHWVEENINEWSRKVFCSECGCPSPFEHISNGDIYSASGYGVNNKTKFCPNCGCAMVEPQERSDKE